MNEVFQVSPAPARAIAFFAGIAALMLAMLVLFALLARASRSTTLSFEPEGLRVHYPFYGRTIPWRSIDGPGARVVDLAQESGLRPRGKRNGTALPGYRSGWFRLGNGGKALVFLSDRNPTVMIPTREGYVLLVSLQRPDSFIYRLRGRV